MCAKDVGNYEPLETKTLFVYLRTKMSAYAQKKRKKRKRQKRKEKSSAVLLYYYDSTDVLFYFMRA